MADPVFANVDNAPVYVENGAAVVLDNDMTLTDPDGDPFNGTQLSGTACARFGLHATRPCGLLIPG